MNLIQILEQEEIARVSAGKTIPDFRAGDTVVVNVNVIEGSRKRLQAFEGVVIARRNRGLNSSFIVRKISSGEGVERTFQLYAPDDRKHRGEAPRRRPPRQALLPCANAPARPPASRNASSARKPNSAFALRTILPLFFERRLVTKRPVFFRMAGFFLSGHFINPVQVLLIAF